MQIFGLDFTSAPSSRKPITCAVCIFTGDHLHIERLDTLPDFSSFETFLSQPGPWLAGFDFPFGQPKKLIQNLDWPLFWEGYVQEVARLGKSGFEQVLAAYRQARPAGDKQHLRTTDQKAKSCSPMMLYGVPVGKMFLAGAPRLLEAGVSVLPCRPTTSNRLAVEAYPKLVARKFIGSQSYKNDSRSKQTQMQKLARAELVAALRSPGIRTYYDFLVHLSDTMAHALVEDPSADRLDALCGAVQAAWAYQQREQNYGIPVNCDPLEGWIVDPELSER